MSASDYQAVFDANVLGTFLCMKHELRAMRRQGFGSVVNLSSSMGVKGAPNASIYTGSKARSRGMTKSIALEAAPFGIRVNAVAPGPIQTEMFNRITVDEEGKRANPGRSDEASWDARRKFVASDQAPFMTGEIVRVNGGKTA